MSIPINIRKGPREKWWYRKGFKLGIVFSFFLVITALLYSSIYASVTTRIVEVWLFIISSAFFILVFLWSFSLFHLIRSYSPSGKRIECWWKDGYLVGSFVGFFIVFTIPFLILEDSLPFDDYLLKIPASLIIGSLGAFLVDRLFFAFSENALADFFGNWRAFSVLLILNFIFLVMTLFIVGS